MQLSMIKIWVLAVRPKTLTAAISPVLIATAMAFGDGVYHLPTAILCLLAALTIQIGTNLANDYFDYKKGADTDDRIGPTRVTQAGLINPGQFKWGFIIIFTISALICISLINRGGWSIIVLAIVSILSGILYTAGPRPLGYIGLGDIFVLIFFGPIAVSFTYYLQSFEMNLAVLLAGFAPGFLSVAILTVNNLRDQLTDKKSGKKTLVVRFGACFGYIEFLSSIILASFIPIVIYLFIEDHKFILLSSFVSIFAIPLFIKVLRCEDLKALNPLLAETGRLLLIYSVIFSTGWIL